MKDLTTGQVAKICKVTPRTVSKWFDSGRLAGYRIPGSQDRRIPRDDLIRFLEEHKMPLRGLQNGHAVLLVCNHAEMTERLISAFDGSDFTINTADGLFTAGMLMEQTKPEAFIIDMALGMGGRHLLCALRENEYKGTVIALANEDQAESELLEDGFDDAFQKPFDVALLVKRLTTLVNPPIPAE